MIAVSVSFTKCNDTTIYVVKITGRIITNPACLDIFSLSILVLCLHKFLPLY
jgi:hypothetical protein